MTPDLRWHMPMAAYDACQSAPPDNFHMRRQHLRACVKINILNGTRQTATRFIS